MFTSVLCSACRAADDAHHASTTTQDGGWAKEELEKQVFISNHFMQLFTAGPIGATKGDR
jgi:hypothetical protein